MESGNSIILVTVCYNDFENLNRTVASVRKFKKNFHRYIVIDGNSSDGSLDLIKQSLDVIDDWISENDKGIYHAMNKVSKFQCKDNDMLLWLNAGDTLLNWNTIDINRLFMYDCAFFAVLTKLNSSSNVKIRLPKVRIPYNEKNFFPKTSFMHQGFLVKYSTFIQYYYDTTVGIQAENLFMSQCIISNRFLVSEVPISVFYLDGVSSRRFYKVLVSYLNVSYRLNFSILKVFIFQFRFITKTLLKVLIPFSVFNLIRKFKE